MESNKMGETRIYCHKGKYSQFDRINLCKPGSFTSMSVKNARIADEHGRFQFSKLVVRSWFREDAIKNPFREPRMP
jgi:hypothetical protein